jgi:DNA-binding response OmpR family regulator
MDKKILIVDDDAAILEPLSLLLEEFGYRVETTAKGDETYKKVTKFGPDLILLDILMSGSDGRIICRRLKKEHKTNKIPVVMMSAHPGAHHDSADAGADDFIAKPFETAHLLTILQKHLD